MTTPSRRSLLRAGVVLAATFVPLGLTKQAFSMVAGGMGSGLRRSTFTPRVGTRFRLVADGRSYPAVLLRVDDIRHGGKGHDQQFSLLFRTRGAGPGDGTYRLEHATMRSQRISVIAVGAKAGVYEAIVNGVVG
jgi:hypothetical protein